MAADPFFRSQTFPTTFTSQSVVGSSSRVGIRSEGGRGRGGARAGKKEEGSKSTPPSPPQPLPATCQGTFAVAPHGHVNTAQSARDTPCLPPLSITENGCGGWAGNYRKSVLFLAPFPGCFWCVEIAKCHCRGRP